MGVLPLTFEEGTTWKTLGLKGDETVTIKGLTDLRAARRSWRRKSPSPMDR